MKKRIILLFTLISLLAFVGCSSHGERHTLEFTIPAGYTGAFTFSDKAMDYGAFVYSAEEISPMRKTLTIKAGAGYSSVPVVLKVVECQEENAYEPVLLTHDKPVTINVEKGAWFQIGIALDNPADVPIAASVIVEDVDVRIANTESIGATETTVDWSEIPGGKRFIVEIRDRAEEEHLFCAEAEELFYDDETTEYYFNVIKSHYVMVTYNNGNSEDIVTALNAGRATIADLDQFGIEYHTEVKSK